MQAISITPLNLAGVNTIAESAFVALLDTACAYVNKLHQIRSQQQAQPPSALLGRIRGTGPGVSFGGLVDAMREAHPVTLRTPFEGSSSVGGAVLHPQELLSVRRDDAMLLLRFEAGSVDLPMHAHEHSDRFIYVVAGRGYFHVSDDPVTNVDPTRIRHIPVRARDALMFHRGTVHTFSTDREPLLLLSYHGPYVPLDDPAQYTVAKPYLCPAGLMDPARSAVSFDPAWNRI